jgi:peptidylprolyl isomerase
MRFLISIHHSTKETDLKTSHLFLTSLHRQSVLLVVALVLSGLLLVACSGVTPAAPAAEAAPTEAPQAEPAAAAVTDTVASAGSGAAALDPAARNGMYTAAPPMTIDPSKVYYATFKTDKGDIKVQLFPECAPLAVNNLVFLAREGYYDNTTFHRVLDGFMAQAGDPTGSGAGGPGYQFEDEFLCDVGFDRPGLLAMANAGPATNGSQFFITFAPTEWLNGLHTIFGEVVEGSEVLDQLTRRDPSAAPTSEGDKLLTVVIEESDASQLAEVPAVMPTPVPLAPSDVDAADRPLAALTGAEKANYFNTPPALTLDINKQYTATIKTAKGEMVMALYDDLAPIAVDNFIALANLGFFDGLPINQVNPSELLVFGAPDNNPRNDAGYQIDAERNLPVELVEGAVAFVPLGSGPEAKSSSSQLLVALFAPPQEINVDFSFFGRIVDGVDVLKQLVMGDIVESVTIETSE